MAANWKIGEKIERQLENALAGKISRGELKSCQMVADHQRNGTLGLAAASMVTV